MNIQSALEPARLAAYVLLLAAGVSALGCSSNRLSADMREVAHKLDAPLRNEMQQASDHDVIHILIGIDAVTETEAHLLTTDGLTLGAQTNRVVTASGTRAAVVAAARHDFVRRIELSREHRPHSPRNP